MRLRSWDVGLEEITLEYSEDLWFEEDGVGSTDTVFGGEDDGAVWFFIGVDSVTEVGFVGWCVFHYLISPPKAAMRLR